MHFCTHTKFGILYFTNICQCSSSSSLRGQPTQRAAATAFDCIFMLFKHKSILNLCALFIVIVCWAYERKANETIKYAWQIAKWQIVNNKWYKFGGRTKQCCIFIWLSDGESRTIAHTWYIRYKDWFYFTLHRLLFS